MDDFESAVYRLICDYRKVNPAFVFEDVSMAFISLIGRIISEERLIYRSEELEKDQQ